MKPQPRRWAGADDAKLVGAIRDALRAHFEREPTSAEVDQGLKRWTRVDAINKRNRDSWDEQSSLPPSPDPAAVVRNKAMLLQLRHVAATAASDAVEKSNRARARAKKASQKRAENVAKGKPRLDERNRRIREQRAAGTKPKSIATKENLHVTTVRKIAPKQKREEK